MSDRKRPRSYEGLDTDTPEDTKAKFIKFRTDYKRYQVAIAQERRAAKIVDVKPALMPSPDILDLRAEDVRAQTALTAPVAYVPFVGAAAVVAGAAFWWMRRAP